MKPLVVVQMAGAPGTGKSALAQAIGAGVEAVVIDHDVVKSALLEAGVPMGDGDPLADPEGLHADGQATAGATAYAVEEALATELVAARVSVVLDSPCYYESVLEAGQMLARGAAAAYRYVECVVDDLEEIDRRLRTRPRLSSQCRSVAQGPEGAEAPRAAEVFRHWIRNVKRPKGARLIVDTAEPFPDGAAAALRFVRGS